MFGLPQLEEGQIVCEVCQDTGLEVRECTGDEACGRRRRHLPHTYAVACACRSTNQAYQIKKAQYVRPA